jgi:hypothetical protein
MLGALAAAIVLYAAAAAGAVSQAKANVGICPTGYYWLAPYGQGGDRCFGPAVFAAVAGVVTFERAGCVTYADTNNNLIQSWVCGSAGSSPGSAAYAYAPNDGIRRKGVIRNNNLSFGGHFEGSVACFSGC